jgi:3',5'-cyclic AMP phosphodiesterase CpdA
VFAFAHFSDLHLAPLPRPKLTELINKRLLSYFSWIQKRERLHRREVLEKAITAMNRCERQHLCVTGDIVNLALDAEIEQAASWLRALGPELTCTVVPGNHDALLRSAVPRIHQAWAPWMSGEGTPGRFPILVRKGVVSFIGLSSAVPTAPGLASGRLDPGQLSRLPEILASTSHDFRVVLIHHPPRLTGDSWRRKLSNAGPLLEILRVHGAELILHGHLQKPVRDEIPGPAGGIPVFGAGSASLIEENNGNSGHFHGFQLEKTAAGWKLRADHFRYRAATEAFGIESTEVLEYPRQSLNPG